MPTSHRYALLYFSGTGNTDWVFRGIEQRLTDAGAACTTRTCDQLLADCGLSPGGEIDEDRLREELARLLDGATHLLLGYPVYESTVPVPMRRLLPLLPDGDGVKLGVVCTYMMAGGDCCHLPESQLVDRGYESVLATYVKMPNNINVPPMGFLHIPEGEALDALLERAGAAVDEVVRWLLEERSHVEGRGIADYLLGVSQRWSESMAVSYVEDNIFALACCNRCRLCADSCPMGNIDFGDGYPEFGRDCCGCLRCYHQCPQHAIQITTGTMDVDAHPRYPGPEGWKSPRVRKVRRRRKRAAAKAASDPSAQ